MSQAGGRGDGARRERVRSLMAGEQRGLVADLGRGLLRAAAWLYGAAVWGRGRLYDAGWKRSARLEVPVVSIGNLTAGGTGKTPLTIHVARRAMERGHRVAVLSRGWRGEGSGPIRNDEGRLLDRRLADAVILQGPDRVALARQAIERHRCNLIVLDDGFQHRRLARDLDIVTIDATCPFGYGHLLPRGLLREPLGGLRRASTIVVTRRDQVSPQRLAAILERLESVAPGVPRLTARHAAVSLRDLDDHPGPPLDSLRDRDLLLLSAIGNPDAFEKTVEALGARVLDHLRLPDHHRYDAAALDEIAAWAGARAESDDVWLLTTEKDAVKLAGRDAGCLDRWRPRVLAIEMALDEPLVCLERLLER